MFQPSHGTAPQLAGQNIANPIAMILSTAMMLDWLGDRHNDPAARDAAVLIETTVAKLLQEGHLRTADQGGSASTSDVATTVANAMIHAGSLR